MARTANKDTSAVLGAGAAAKKFTVALKKPPSIRSFVERQKALAVAAAERAAGAVLLKGKPQLARSLAPRVVLAAVRHTDSKTNVGEILSAVKLAGVTLTPAAISAALQTVKMPPHKIAKALSAMGVSAATIADAVSMLDGSSNPVKVAHAMALGGFAVSDIVSALGESGLANESNAMAIINAAGLKISEKQMKKSISSGVSKNPGHKVVDNVQKLATKTGLPSGAASTIAALKKAGLPVTPINVAKAIKKIGMSTSDSVKTLTALGVSRGVIGAAMKEAGFSSTAVLNSEHNIVSSSQINEAALAQIGRISATASDVIKSMLKKKIALTSGNLRNALKGEGVKGYKIEGIVSLVHPAKLISKMKTKAKRFASKMARVGKK